MTAFVDQVAVVTGASSGIGKAIALNLAAQGATLCLVGRNQETLKIVAGNAGTEAKIRCYRADLALDEDIQALTMSLQQDFTKIDVLVHSAGVISLGRLDEASIADFDKQYRINVRAPYVLTQALLPMLKVCQGQIVFINSSAGLLKAGANMSQYAATKYALRAIADSLRAEVNDIGVRVLSVYPGRTASRMQAAVHKIEGRPYRPDRLVQPEDVAVVVVNALGLPRSAEVTDISVRPMTNRETR